MELTNDQGALGALNFALEQAGRGGRFKPARVELGAGERPEKNLSGGLIGPTVEMTWCAAFSKTSIAC